MSQSSDDSDRSAAAPVLGQKVLRPRQQVEEALRRAVLDGKLKIGDRLPSETELARQFSVSRPTVREALSSLQSQGLIRKTPGAGGGSFVQPVDHRALGQVLQESMHNLLRLGGVNFDEVAAVREHLEVPAVVLATLDRTDDQLAELHRILKEQKHRTVDDPMIAELDAKFHITIARMSGNRVLAALIYALHRESEPVSYLELSPEMGRESYAQHQRIVTAIENQDPEEGERAIRDHLAYLRTRIRKHVMANQRQPAGDAS